MATAYLHFGKGDEPRLTVEVPVKETPLPMKGRTMTGYGNSMPSPYMVKHNGRWRRVYVACFSNAASHYIGRPGAWIATFNLWS